MHQTYEVTWKQIESHYLLLRILLIRIFYEEIQLKILASKQVTLRSHFFQSKYYFSCKNVTLDILQNLTSILVIRISNFVSFLKIPQYKGNVAKTVSHVMSWADLKC